MGQCEEDEKAEALLNTSFLPVDITKMSHIPKTKNARRVINTGEACNNSQSSIRDANESMSEESISEGSIQYISVATTKRLLVLKVIANASGHAQIFQAATSEDPSTISTTPLWSVSVVEIDRLPPWAYRAHFALAPRVVVPNPGLSPKGGIFERGPLGDRERRSTTSTSLMISNFSPEKKSVKAESFSTASTTTASLTGTSSTSNNNGTTMSPERQKTISGEDRVAQDRLPKSVSTPNMESYSIFDDKKRLSQGRDATSESQTSNNQSDIGKRMWHSRREPRTPFEPLVNINGAPISRLRALEGR